jgi:hypothetical protein
MRNLDADTVTPDVIQRPASMDDVDEHQPFRRAPVAALVA